MKFSGKRKIVDASTQDDKLDEASLQRSDTKEPGTQCVAAVSDDPVTQEPTVQRIVEYITFEQGTQEPSISLTVEAVTDAQVTQEPSAQCADADKEVVVAEHLDSDNDASLFSDVVANWNADDDSSSYDTSDFSKS